MTSTPPSHPSEQLAALRIVDVNLNRASEGLRVVEEYCRFVLSDSRLTARCKQLRDQLHAAVNRIARTQRLAARDTLHDVGAARDFVVERPEVSTLSLEQIAMKNGERVKEALRAIEEYSKPFYGEVAREVGALRYQWYTLEKDCRFGVIVSDSLQTARLYVLIDGGSSECEFVERAQALIAAGVQVLQLRDKKLDDRTLLARARLLRRVIDEFAARSQEPEYIKQSTFDFPQPPAPSPQPHLFIINDCPDIAVLSRADGVHVGQDELTVHDARQIVGSRLLIGVSTHSLEQARQAVLDGANYLGCGPTFPSGTKQFNHFPGLEFLRQVAAEISLPAFAIGGITLEKLPQVLATGFTRVVVGGAITTVADCTASALSFLNILRCTSEETNRR